ncbi:RecX family transcriptional regulator [Desulfobotulus sp. H1]|uniref:Regulatory protein RecX n=1 Tax=Desulfobotulus pelophilus TaxID=2823377 RepID=A0ABT3NCB1_9BACT|nr:RecX family transcriptional regulator [Desulfobotulus pelophilus]MCW7755110.1 RecX family transcriptional regulator [Desulfobotulus pelophilus]
MEETELRRVLTAAMGILGRRSLSRKELKTALEKKKACTDVVERAIQICMERGYIDEEERARQIIQSGIRSGHGPLRIQRDLDKRGIPDILVRKIQGCVSPEKERAYLAQTARKKLASIREDNPLKRKAKLYRFLISRGYPSSDVLDFMNEMDPD